MNSEKTRRTKRTQDLLKESFERLIEEGRQILREVGWDASRYETSFPANEDYFRFRTLAMNLVRRACGDDSDHYRELGRLALDKDASKNSYYFPLCLGVLEAAQRDFALGLLFDMRALIRAEVLEDFMEQAETLLDAGYHIPAASLAGAILEDALRKLCSKHDLPVPSSTKIDRLNADLVRANVYSKLTQKKITTLADIRNNADHGHFDEFKESDVEEMVKWTRNFTVEYLE